MAVATGVEPVPPDRQSGILPLDSATSSQFGCEGTIRTCMNRVRAGYPGQLDDLATMRREPADTVCFFPREETVAFTTPRNSLPVNFLLSRFQDGCRGAIRTPVPGFKIQRPATRRPGIKPSALSLSCTACTTPPIRRRCGRVSGDPYAHDLPIRDDRRRDRSRVPMQARFQTLRVQSFVYS